MILMRTATLSDGTIESFAHSLDYKARYWVTIDARTGMLLDTNVKQDSDEFSRLLKAACGHLGFTLAAPSGLIVPSASPAPLPPGPHAAYAGRRAVLDSSASPDG
jgi:hypothetical protein